MPEENVRNSRSGTAAQLAAGNRWLEDGETVVESDTGNTRTGPGHWNDLTPNLAAGGSGATALPAVVLEMNSGPAGITGGTGSKTLVWDTLYSDEDASTLVALPDGIGFTYNASTGVFTATEVGRWIVEVAVVVATDATAKTSVIVSRTLAEAFGPATIRVAAPSDNGTVAVVSRQIGQTFKVSAAAYGATADPYSAFDYATCRVSRIQ